MDDGAVLRSNLWLGHSGFRVEVPLVARRCEKQTEQSAGVRAACRGQQCIVES